MPLLTKLRNFYWSLAQDFPIWADKSIFVLEKANFYIDLLFYHARLHCYVVVELKTEKFKPEFAGKIKFLCNCC